MFRVGFTGNKDVRLTKEQRETFIETILRLSAGRQTEFHHGDCIGADTQVHEIVEEIKQMLSHLLFTCPIILR